MSYRTFTRDWWKPNPTWPDGREPGAGPRHYLPDGEYDTEEEARARCREYNTTHDPGPMSHKAEYEEV